MIMTGIIKLTHRPLGYSFPKCNVNLHEETKDFSWPPVTCLQNIKDFSKLKYYWLSFGLLSCPYEDKRTFIMSACTEGPTSPSFLAFKGRSRDLEMMG